MPSKVSNLYSKDDPTMIVYPNVQAANIPSNAITADKVADGAITTAKVNDGAITAAKIASNAVTSGKIASQAVTTGKIDTAAVTADKIAENAVTTDKIANGAIHAEQVSSGATELSLLWAGFDFNDARAFLLDVLLNQIGRFIYYPDADTYMNLSVDYTSGFIFYKPSGTALNSLVEDDGDLATFMSTYASDIYFVRITGE